MNYRSYSESALTLEMLENPELKYKIAGNMVKFGGKFIQSLAGCLMSADRKAMFKLVSAFRTEVVEYLPENWGGKNE